MSDRKSAHSPAGKGLIDLVLSDVDDVGERSQTTVIYGKCFVISTTKVFAWIIIYVAVIGLALGLMIINSYDSPVSPRLTHWADGELFVSACSAIVVAFGLWLLADIAEHVRISSRQSMTNE